MEEEVNYASVVFKTKKRYPPKPKEEEETVYNEVRVRSKPTEKAADTIAKEEEEPVYNNEVRVRSKPTENTVVMNVSAGLLPDKRTDSRGRCYQQVAYCLGILCVILLLGFISVCVYISTISNESEKHLKENQILLALNLSLTNLNNKLSSENENLKRDNDNLRQKYNVLESKTTNLNADKQNLESQNSKLSTENQNLTSQNSKLSTENQNLTSQNSKLSAENQKLKTTLETQWTVENEFNVSRAQWSIDAFCPKKNRNRQCQACQDGWKSSHSSCYAINNPDGYYDQKTWEAAQEDCRGKISDLAVIADQTEKTFINETSWSSSGTNGYWIGLKAKDGKWKWVDGRDLTESSWIQEPATDGQCVISVQTEGWKSVSCGKRNRWICKKKALSL